MAADTPNAAEARLSRQVTHPQLTPLPSLCPPATRRTWTRQTTLAVPNDCPHPHSVRVAASIDACRWLPISAEPDHICKGTAWLTCTPGCNAMPCGDSRRSFLAAFNHFQTHLHLPCYSMQDQQTFLSCCTRLHLLLCSAQRFHAGTPNLLERIQVGLMKCFKDRDIGRPVIVVYSQMPYTNCCSSCSPEVRCSYHHHLPRDPRLIYDHQALLDEASIIDFNSNDCQQCKSRVQAYFRSTDCWKHLDTNCQELSALKIPEASLLPSCHFTHFVFLTDVDMPLPATFLTVKDWPKLTHFRVSIWLSNPHQDVSQWFSVNGTTLHSVLATRLQVLLLVFVLDVTYGQAAGPYSHDVGGDIDRDFVTSGEHFGFEDCHVVVGVTNRGFSFDCVHNWWEIARIYQGGEKQVKPVLYEGFLSRCPLQVLWVHFLPPVFQLIIRS